MIECRVPELIPLIAELQAVACPPKAGRKV
jgi:hypothetical protein